MVKVLYGKEINPCCGKKV